MLDASTANETTLPTFNSTIQAKAKVDPALLLLIKEMWRQRQDIHTAEKSSTNRMKSICRRFFSDIEDMKKQIKAANALFEKVAKVFKKQDKNKPFDTEGDPQVEAAMVHLRVHWNCFVMLNKERKALEKEIAPLIEKLPVWDTDAAKNCFGINIISVATIVGEAGDLNNYNHIKQLYKRMGVGVVQGKRQRKVTTDKALAILMGYQPKRRSALWVIGINCLKDQSPYRKVYDARKLRQETEWPKSTKAHRNNDAKRIAEKAWLADFYTKWREVTAVSEEIAA